jgi:hypothetical protein
MWNRNNAYEYRDPSGLDPYVIYDPAGSAGIAGHLMIAIINHATGTGLLWSQGPALPMAPVWTQIVTVKVVTLKDLAALVTQKHMVIIKEATSIAQDIAMNGKAMELIAKQGELYTAWGNNCCDFVKNVLGAGDPLAAERVTKWPAMTIIELLKQGAGTIAGGYAPGGFQLWDTSTMPGGQVAEDFTGGPFTGAMGNPANGPPMIQPHTHL